MDGHEEGKDGPQSAEAPAPKVEAPKRSTGQETASVAVLERPVIARTARWSPRKFARARMEGHNLAECAKIAGSKATDENNLYRTGYRWIRTPQVQKCLGDTDADLERGWKAWVRHAADVCDGLVTGATEIDILGSGLAIGRALGKFVQLHADVTPNVIAYRRLFDVKPGQVIEGQAGSLPALPAGLDALPTDQLVGMMAQLSAVLASRSNPQVDACKAVVKPNE